jgi:hypothetical protein
MAEHQRTLRELIKTVKALDIKLAQSESKSEDLKITLGLTLAEAKLKLQAANKEARKGETTTWPDFLEKHFTFKRSRADELIQIGAGSKTLSETNERAATGMKAIRARRNVTAASSSTALTTTNTASSGGEVVVAANEESAESIAEKVGKFHTELMTFADQFCGHLENWSEDHPGLDDESKAALVQALELAAGRFQQLAQAIDGR